MSENTSLLTETRDPLSARGGTDAATLDPVACSLAFGSRMLAPATLPVQAARLLESQSPSQRGVSVQVCRPCRPSRPPPPSMSSSLAVYGMS